MEQRKNFFDEIEQEWGTLLQILIQKQIKNIYY